MKSSLLISTPYGIHILNTVQVLMMKNYPQGKTVYDVGWLGNTLISNCLRLSNIGLD